MKQRLNFTEKQFQSIIKSSNLMEIKLFQVNDNYFEFPEKKILIIDGGIELNFGNNVFSLAWNQETDSFSFENRSFEKTYENDNYTKLNTEFIQDLNKKKISSAKFKWFEYDIIIDYTMATKKESKLVEIKIEFESDEKILIATVDYELEENSSPKNYSYDVNGELLIALNEIEINSIG